MKIAIYTLGCKVNQYETQAMERLLRQRGHQIVDFSQDADAYVVNSCSVTAVSDQKSRQALHKIRRERPGAVLALCGCYAQTHPGDMEQLDADLIAGTGDRAGFITLLEQAAEDRSRRTALDRAFDRRDFEILPAGGLDQRTRAMLKVEDGCVNFCSYCIIPYARGPVRSLPLDQAAEQAAALAAAGYREIVLTGIEISSWGRDLDGRPGLADLIEAVCAAAPGVRVRLGSLEPRTVTEAFCRRCADLPDLCPQFHLSLQSGCDETLRRMNRKYGTARYLQSVELLNRWFDRPAVTTDLITGFPEETEEEFAQTLAFIQKCGFAKMHIFPYSVRPGTPAEKMAQVPKAVKAERARRAAAAAEEMRSSYLRGCVGRTYAVLFEQPREGRFLGHAPNYMEVVAEGENLHNIVKNVHITGTNGEVLLGRLAED
ncbi:tRNA (N(6)-L-threonylcarbamoyladenosine(37)-C(2))-methylthiotransferase MtaB [Oscillibacter sp.]|jgi:threonylcarbamoyladenosine tRNA methylthiotransferase MtaB|uniref:tRNA (N(6)-L-threonylcarbamoyladenosine(37)-C(2))- methylthiotransferase MtaB n=1 Tax=Oscillibacter sp. TaxID=1945593 RepID=UPI00217379E3|nr:tRNA (N(6)-L-threonylcarbamoyladenosine(37)-C(2))-methylthiotransferase MtaB [Oscillibacter sp.]MCI9649401.1 tRNA (N(6)-L-threonylcarbamoyladenosine(37)-C(2))-methylthiotransferase MtaB [Oscillibacter sp.]